MNQTHRFQYVNGAGRTDAFKSMMNIQVWKVLAGGREGFGRRLFSGLNLRS